MIHDFISRDLARLKANYAEIGLALDVNKVVEAELEGALENPFARALTERLSDRAET